MRIVHLSIGALPPPFGGGGGALQRRIAELALEQRRQGHDVIVLVAERFAGRRTFGGVEVRYLRSRSGPRWMHIEHQLRSVAEVAFRLGRAVDVIHVHNEPEAAVLGRPLGMPLVLHYDNFYFRGRERLFGSYRRALCTYDVLMPVSEYCRAESAAFWRLPASRCRVVPNGVNTSQFSPDPAGAQRERARLQLGPDPVLLYLGRVCRQKGSDTLLSAFSRYRALGGRAELLIAGPVEQFGPVERRAEEQWRTEMRRCGARYLGLVDEDRLAPLLTLADVFVMPTRELEMQGMAALEAQACGTPVVASDHGGLRETVPDSCGVRFRPGDDAALADAIRQLLREPGRRRALGAEAIRHAESFAWPRVTRMLEPVYELAAQNRRAHR